MKEICRFCKHYHPDERYQGKVGICDIDSGGVAVSETCPWDKSEYERLEGEPVWLSEHLGVKPVLTHHHREVE